MLTIHVLPQLASVLLLLFAGLIFATLLDRFTAAVDYVLPGPRGLAYFLVLALITGAIVGVGLLIGPRIMAEVPQLTQRVPQAWQQLLARLNDSSFMHGVVVKAQQPMEWLGENAPVLSLATNTFGGLSSLLVVLLVGVYAAATPQRYVDFSRQILPGRDHEAAVALAGDLAGELRHWLAGRCASMLIVGAATGIALWVLGVRLAFTLGLLAGLLSFVPYIGPVLGLLPSLLMSSVQSLALGGWVLLLYALVQLVESTLLTPLIQQRVVRLPPVILIAAQMIGGVLVGALGVLMAAPLMVTALTWARWHREHHG